jgi:hypothetical protein
MMEPAAIGKSRNMRCVKNRNSHVPHTHGNGNMCTRIPVIVWEFPVGGSKNTIPDRGEMAAGQAILQMIIA